MSLKLKNSIPKRDDFEYKEMEKFADYELVNNAFYEMGIRNKDFQKLTKQYSYCEVISKKINKQIKLEDFLKNNESKDYTQNECNTFVIEKKTEKEHFEEALEKIENNIFEKYDTELYRLVKLDFEDFKKEIDILFLENKTNEELLNDCNNMDSFLYMIPEIIEKKFYIDFYSFYNKEDDNIVRKDIEYEESMATSLYIKREYKSTHYIETIIDSDNNTVTKTLYPLLKRKLLINHIPKFSLNHLIIYDQATKFIIDFFKATKVKLKKQVALADAFFCYDYYTARLKEVAEKNQNIKEENLNNTILQEAIENISLINDDTSLTYQEKAQKRIPYDEIVKCEELSQDEEPTINKTSKFYIFKELKFKKSGINYSTALKYYQWIKPYIEYKYIEVINTKPLL